MTPPRECWVHVQDGFVVDVYDHAHEADNAALPWPMDRRPTVHRMVAADVVEVSDKEHQAYDYFVRGLPLTDAERKTLAMLRGRMVVRP